MPPLFRDPIARSEVSRQKKVHLTCSGAACHVGRHTFLWLEDDLQDQAMLPELSMTKPNGVAADSF